MVPHSAYRVPGMMPPMPVPFIVNTLYIAPGIVYRVPCASYVVYDCFSDRSALSGRRRFVELETGTLAHPSPMPPDRLMTLLQQAVSFQIDSGRYHPKVRLDRRICW